ncbi:uracil-DNA glycosylase [Microbulbifer rhizosphaerae]|uniref:Uracil-DNA glycosylase n=1 Tax=Microbulbifer rhizosphaerae TaxID=1562603 RepID=A0A7W4W9Q7_9GAMM|nr:uracil-DNA glycosylase [Microbulbifer rhizosphaerae]MBB3060270.1 uracil-DNA glycosylase [Microbulbifer rhizosphaerae]
MQVPNNIKIHPSWYAVLQDEFEKPYMEQLRQFLRKEKAAGKVIYPPGPQVFNAFNSTPFEEVKVVILGQDPYHGPGQAHGLCFSVKPGVPVPPSLQNIFKELQSDLGIDPPNHGCLQPWAEQGVLLLNATLTVERGRAGSHQGRGWEQFTDAAIHKLAEKREDLVFILWGSYAQKKGAFIDSNKHRVMRAPHPSPLSAHRGFFGTRPFSQANDYLLSNSREPIDWALPVAAELDHVAVEV